VAIDSLTRAGKKRVLLVNKAYWPHLGGVETVVRQLAEAAAAAGFEVGALCLAEKDREEEINSVKVHRIKTALRIGSAPLARKFLEKYSELAAKADVIHFHAPNPMGELALLLRGRGKAGRVICTYHSDPLRPRWVAGAYQRLLRLFLDRCDTVVATSPNYIQSSPVLKPIEGHCTVIPLGVDVERFSKVNSDAVARCEEMLEGLPRPRVLFVGRLVYYKGVDVLIKAIAQVPGVSCVIVGKGPLKDDLVDLATELGLASVVRFVDPMPEDLYPAIYHCADLFVLPSVERTEAFGIVALEAMAAGLPIITTELGTGTSYYNRDGENGAVIPPGSVNALALAFRQVLTGFSHKSTAYGPGKSRRLGFSLGDFLSAYGELYTKAETGCRSDGAR